MSFVFAETQGMQSAAATTAALAENTAIAGGQAGDSVVVPNPLWDSFSLSSALKMNQYATEAAAHLQTGAGLQVDYGQSIFNAAQGYVLCDSAGAAGIGQAVGAAGQAGLV